MKSLIFIAIVIITFSHTFAKIINVPSEYPSIQGAINISQNGDTIIVAPGVYSENLNFIGKKITVSSFYLLMNDEIYITNTIIQGKEQCSVITFECEEDRNSSLIGFTIQNGYDSWSGGGIYCDFSSPTLKHLIIKENHAGGGGGIFCINQSSPYLQNVLITANTAEIGGGIMSMSNSKPVLANVTITGNEAELQGDGLVCCGSQPFILNSIITDSIFCAGWSEKSTYVISHSNISMGYQGLVVYENLELNWLDGNLNADPGFVDVTNRKYNLNDYSNCIDKGLTDFIWMDEMIFSLEENDYNGMAPDMGAFEYKHQNLD